MPAVKRRKIIAYKNAEPPIYADPRRCIYMSTHGIKMWQNLVVPKEIFESSYECDCGHQSHFCVSTVWEVKATSMKKTVHLLDPEREEHTIVFYKGKMVDILCPKAEQKSSIRRTAKKRAKRRS
jgi:hypothetical protein